MSQNTRALDKYNYQKYVYPPEISYIKKTSVVTETCWIADADPKETNMGQNLKENFMQ